MDTAKYIKQRLQNTDCTHAWRSDNLEEAVAWQSRLRSHVGSLIGCMNWERVPLDAVTTETIQFPGYRREAVQFVSRPGLEMFGYFLLPAGANAPLPAVVCLPGHGRGVDSIVGIAADGSVRTPAEPAEYQQDFALQCVAHGYAVFAVEQFSFGHRRDIQAQAAGLEASSCNRDSMAALMLGETMTGWRVWDAIRAIDFLQSRPEVDPDRIGAMGISGGGLTSLFTACMDVRVKCAVVSGYFNTFRDSVLAINHCVDNFIPGISGAVEMPDLAGLIAPRALFVESGTTDSIFPLFAFAEAVKRAEDIFAIFGASDKFGSEVFDGGHSFYGVGAFQFMETML